MQTDKIVEMKSGDKTKEDTPMLLENKPEVIRPKAFDWTGRMDSDNMQYRSVTSSKESITRNILGKKEEEEEEEEEIEWQSNSKNISIRKLDDKAKVKFVSECCWDQEWQTKELQYKELPLWEGPLLPFNWFELNKRKYKTLSHATQQIESALETMVKQELIDYSVDEQSIGTIHGRVFGQNEWCSFVVSLLNIPCPSVSANCNKKINNNNNNNNNNNVPIDDCKSIMEIRRFGGDTFVFQHFFQLFSQQMKQVQIIACRDCRCDNDDSYNDNVNYSGFENEEEEGYSANLCNRCRPQTSTTFACLSLDFGKTKWDLDSLMGENAEDDTCDSAFSESNPADDEDKIMDWISCIINRDSDEDYIRFCTVEWLDEIGSKNSDKEAMERALTRFATEQQRYVVDDMLSVLLADFFDVFCIRNILKIVCHIVEMAKFHSDTFTHMYRDLNHLTTQIKHVKQQWSAPLSFQVSANCSLKFAHSQQIVKCCNDCLDVVTATH